MMSSEFDVINEYFTLNNRRSDVSLAVGDDGAVVTVAEHNQLVVTTDTLISGVHFPEHSKAEDIAYKSLMVNLSDLAAMGATPAWVTLAITLPEINPTWLSAFSAQFARLLDDFDLSLIGGDTTRGPLSITVQAMGFCQKGKALRRDQANAGDRVYVTGSIGDAAIGLQVLRDEISDDRLRPCIDRLNRPMARVAFAQDLTTICCCAIDISDGLVADLGHILQASQCGANIKLNNIPLSSTAQYYFDQYHDNVTDWSMLITRGDDYELCFVSPAKNETVIHQLSDKHHLHVSCIGEITDGNDIGFYDEYNNRWHSNDTGFKHF